MRPMYAYSRQYIRMILLKALNLVLANIRSNNCCFADVFCKRESNVDTLHNRALLVQSPLLVRALISSSALFSDCQI